MSNNEEINTKLTDKQDYEASGKEEPADETEEETIKNKEETKIPEEFVKILKDLVTDILITFPEYKEKLNYLSTFNAKIIVFTCIYRFNWTSLI